MNPNAPQMCKCHQCLATGMTDADYQTLKADEAMYLIAPLMESGGDYAGAQRQRDWALATYPARGNA